MFDWVNFAVGERSHDWRVNAELRHILEEERLIQAQEWNVPFYYEALAALGRRLSAWGAQLQDHYDLAEPAVEESPHLAL